MLLCLNKCLCRPAAIKAAGCGPVTRNCVDTTPINIITAAGLVAVLILVGLAILVVRIFVKRVLSQQGPFGARIQQSQELAKEALGISKDCLQVEREMLAVQKETNELLKRIAAKLDQKP